LIGAMLIALALQDMPVAPDFMQAEQAVNARADAEGLWTALTRFAAPDATRYAPRRMTVARPRPVDESPGGKRLVAAGYVSCDGETAISSGQWHHEDRRGYFVTVWEQQTDRSWRWTLDFGDRIAAARPQGEAPQMIRASCDNIPAVHGAMQGWETGDGSLRWRVEPTQLGHALLVDYWDGSSYRRAIEESTRPFDPRRYRDGK
jgi:hypothetical protein